MANEIGSSGGRVIGRSENLTTDDTDDIENTEMWKKGQLNWVIFSQNKLVQFKNCADQAAPLSSFVLTQKRELSWKGSGQ